MIDSAASNLYHNGCLQIAALQDLPQCHLLS